MDKLLYSNSIISGVPKFIAFCIMSIATWKKHLELLNFFMVVNILEFSIKKMFCEQHVLIIDGYCHSFQLDSFNKIQRIPFQKIQNTVILSTI